MQENTTASYFILRKGAVQEEPMTWEEIEAMAGAGLIEPDTLIFIPEENDWRPAADTGLAPFFSAAASATVDPAMEAALVEQYEELCREVAHSSDWNMQVQAAEIAMKLGKRDEAVDHFNAALSRHRFHPRIVQEAKRILAPAERRRLLFFERMEPPWTDPVAIATFPFRSGPVPLLAPVALLAVLSLVPLGYLVAVPLLFVWSVAIARATMTGGGPPTAQALVLDPAGNIIRPLRVLGVVALQTYGPLIMIAGIMAIAGGGETGVFKMIEKSPLILMLMLAITVLYMPAVLVLTSVDGVRASRIHDVRFVLRAIRTMEAEYLYSVGLIVAPLIAWAIIDFAFTTLPIVGDVVSAAVGSYVVLCAGMILGRLAARFRDHFAKP